MPPNNINCYGCGGLGHIRRNCPQGQQCYRCGQTEHVSQDCPSETDSYFNPDSPPPSRSNALVVRTRKKAKEKSIDFSKPDQDFVTIVVGKDNLKKSFRIHRDLISLHSAFFKAAFEGPFVEGQTQTMKLDDVDTELFGVIVHWLYTKRIKYNESSLLSRITLLPDETGSCKVCLVPASDRTFANIQLGSQRLLIVLAMIWNLADRCLLPQLQNVAMKIIHKKIYAVAWDEIMWMVVYCYETTQETTALKRAIVECLCWDLADESFSDWLNSLGNKAIAGALSLDLVSDLPRTLQEMVDHNCGNQVWRNSSSKYQKMIESSTRRRN